MCAAQMEPLHGLLFPAVHQLVGYSSYSECIVVVVCVSCTMVHGSWVKMKTLIPSILFTGVYEALELRDGGSDYLGKGVSKVYF